jgi:hypothetical protein
VEQFIDYGLRGFVDELREQLDMIRREQMNVTWENYVHELFRDMDTPARRRQKHIVLDLPADLQPVSRARLRDLSLRIALGYAGKTSKTVTRDLNWLQEMDLIRRTKGGVIANRQLIQAFLPVRAAPDRASSGTP